MASDAGWTEPPCHANETLSDEHETAGADAREGPRKTRKAVHADRLRHWPANVHETIAGGNEFWSIRARRSVRFAEQDRKLARPAHRALRPSHLPGRIEPEIGNTLQPLLDRDRHLHAR